jgi:hypothetical protein
MFKWFRPRHTVDSVARTLADGLATGTVRLRPAAADSDPPAPPVNGTAHPSAPEPDAVQQPGRAVTERGAKP